MVRYQDRFIELVDYIEANLDSELDVDKLCDLVHLSKFHFHRQFSAFLGMSVISLVRLLRIKRAAYQLAYRKNEKILEIALSNGYESHEAFSRAFKKHFDQSPSDFRESADWSLWQKKYQPILELRKNVMTRQIDYQVNIVAFPQTNIAAFEHRGAPHLLGESMRQFIQWRKQNGLPPSKSRTFNLVYDDPYSVAPEDYRFDICCEVEQKVKENIFGVKNKQIPAGNCAVVRHVGSDDSIGALVEYLYSEWLSITDYELRDFPIFFERVTFFPEVSEKDMITDVYLPIQ